MSNKNRIVPKLRFPEFRDAGEWEEKRLGEVATFKRGKGISKADIVEDGKNKCIRYGELYTVYNGNEIIKTVVSLTNTEIGSSVLSEKNDILMPTSDVTPNGLATASALDETGIILGGDILIIRTPSILNSFFCYFVSSHKNKIMRLVSGVTVYHIYGSDMATLHVNIPTLREQQKIAACLSSLDDLITTQAQKLAQLKTHKKGLMQLLFPAEGETQPKLRFPQFQDAGEWEEKRLGQLGELVNGLTYSPDDIRDEGLLVLRASNVQNGEMVLGDNVFVTPDVKGANLSKPDDILICVRNGSKALIGKNALLPEGLPLCTHGAFMTVFRSASAKFVFQIFQTDAYGSQVVADLGATINSINGRNLINYRFYVPLPPEQQKIAACLSSLDDLITTQAQKLAQLKTHKKGLMQQMFPAPDEVNG